MDPASISSGWAYFVGPKLVDSGTIAAPAKHSVGARLGAIYSQYVDTFRGRSVLECHVEQLPRRCHHYTHWSVGVIAAALSHVGCPDVRGDIPVRSWQKHCNWSAIETTWKERGLKSEDELAAICMGKYWMGVAA